MANYYDKLGDYHCLRGEFNMAIQPYYNVYVLARKYLSVSGYTSHYTKYEALKMTLDLMGITVHEPGAWFADGGIKLSKVHTFKMVFAELDKTPNALAFATMTVANLEKDGYFGEKICTALDYFKKHAKEGEVDANLAVATELFRMMLTYHKGKVEGGEEEEEADEMEGGGYTANVAAAVGKYTDKISNRVSRAFGFADFKKTYKVVGIETLVETLVDSIVMPPIVAIYKALNRTEIKLNKVENFEATVKTHINITDALKNLPNVKAAVWPGKIEAPGFNPSVLTALFTKEPKLTKTSTVYCVVDMSLSPYADMEGLVEFQKKYKEGAPLTCDERTREIKLLTKLKYPSLYEAAENLGHERPAVRAEVGHQGVVRRYPKKDVVDVDGGNPEVVFPGDGGNF